MFIRRTLTVDLEMTGPIIYRMLTLQHLEHPLYQAGQRENTTGERVSCVFCML